MNFSNNNTIPNIPAPIVGEIEVLAFRHDNNPVDAVKALLKGEYVLVEDVYSTGLAILAKLKSYLRLKYSEENFQAQREFRAAYHDASRRLIVVVQNQRLALRKAPEIGFLGRFYPNQANFLLSFPEVQGLNSAWQWYEKGISMPGLNHKLHPFFGTYFPTRFDHLQLFESWLKKYVGVKKQSVDVGVGSGVLSFMMLKHGFETVVGTDSNPNAIVGAREDAQRMGVSGKLGLIHGDLLADFQGKADLIVFNPPWLPAQGSISGLDSAIYYDDSLFSRFFEQSFRCLEPDGKLVILFSNLGVTAGVANTNPVEVELASGGRFTKVQQLTRNVKEASVKTKRNQTWRAAEQVELWELKKSE